MIDDDKLKQCNGLTARGTRCKRRQTGDYCYQHPPGTHYQNIRDFLQSNAALILSFLENNPGDTVAQGFIEALGIQPAAPAPPPPSEPPAPVPVAETNSRIEALCQSWQHNRDPLSLTLLVGYLRLGMPREDVVALLGTTMFEYPFSAAQPDISVMEYPSSDEREAPSLLRLYFDNRAGLVRFAYSAAEADLLDITFQRALKLDMKVRKDGSVAYRWVPQKGSEGR